MDDVSSHTTLQSAVLSSFWAILGGDQSQRKTVEEDLQRLEVAESVALTQFWNQDCDTPRFLSPAQFLAWCWRRS